MGQVYAIRTKIGSRDKQPTNVGEHVRDEFGDPAFFAMVFRHRGPKLPEGPMRLLLAFMERNREDYLSGSEALRQEVIEWVKSEARGPFSFATIAEMFDVDPDRARAAFLGERRSYEPVRPGRPPNHERDEMIRRLAANGMSQTEIARRVGIDRCKLHRIMKRLGLRTRPTKRQIIRELYDQKVAPKDIAERLKMSRSAVYSAIWGGP